MKKAAFERVGKRYRKHLLFIVSMLASLAILMLILLTTENRKAVEKELYLLEQQKHSYGESTLLEAFSQITSVNNYFASMVLQETEFPLPAHDAEWYTRLNDRATTCITLLNYIKGIDVANERVEYHKGEENAEFSADPGQDPRFLVFGRMNDITIAALDGGIQDKIFFYKVPGEADYAENRVVISVDARYLGQMVTGTTTDSEYRCVMDGSGRIVLSDRQSDIQQNFFQRVGLPDHPVEEGGSDVRIGDESFLLSVSRIDSLELYYVSLTRREIFQSYYSSMTMRMVLIGLLFMLAAIVLGVIITSRTYRPIRQLLRTLNAYFPQSFLDHSLDEINYMTERFKQIYTDNTELVNAVDRDIVHLREQQAAALQAQISPHFIYNTLDAINWISLDSLGRQNPISLCVLNTAEVLKSCMDQSTMFDTLEREIAITRNYIEVLKIRYNNTFAVDWQVDESLFACKVLKICMQPIVENMAFHGLACSDGQGKMQIVIGRQEDNTLKISISDNGVGISAVRLEELRQSINDAKSSPSSHIGMRNVNLRLKLIYGERYGVELFSRQGEGTTCILTMPIDFERG